MTNSHETVLIIKRIHIHPLGTLWGFGPINTKFVSWVKSNFIQIKLRTQHVWSWVTNIFLIYYVSVDNTNDNFQPAHKENLD